MNTIRFDYDIYFRQNCIVPVCGIIFSILGIVLLLISLIRGYHDLDARNFKNEVIKGTFVFCIIVHLTIGCILPLAHGGIYMLFEKEKEAKHVSGKIEDMIDLPLYGGGKYYDENNQFKGHGKCIVIDGTKYYLMYGDLNVGDDITIRVLPKSKLVLELTINEEGGSL